MEEKHLENTNSAVCGSDISNERTHYVIIIHGIRTQAEYHTWLANELQKNPSIKAITLGYEFLDVVRFLTFGRNGPVRKITRDIRDVKTMEPRPEQLSIIAHSFGTYIVSKIFERHTDIDFHRVIFCGSIVPATFRWDKYKSRFTDQVLNDCGMHDIWPVFAKFATWGYGPSGRFGFKSNRVRDRFHRFKHSEFFEKKFFQTYWKPFLETGEIVEGELERDTTPWWISLLTLIKAPVLLLATGLLAFILIGIENPKPDLSPDQNSGAMEDAVEIPGFEVVEETVDTPEFMEPNLDHEYEYLVPDFFNWGKEYEQLVRYVGEGKLRVWQEEQLSSLLQLQENTPGAYFKVLVITNDVYWEGSTKIDAVCEYIEALLKSRADPLVECRGAVNTYHPMTEDDRILQEFIVQVSESASAEYQKLNTPAPSVTAEPQRIVDAIAGIWMCRGGGFSYTVTLSSTGDDTFIGSADFGQTAPAGYNSQVIQNGRVSGRQIQWVRDPSRQNIFVTVTVSDDVLSMQGEGSGRDGDAAIHCTR